MSNNAKFTSTIIQEDNSISAIATKVKEVDIHSLDVKMAPTKNKMAASQQQKSREEDEVDFFADMTPDIPTQGLNLEKIQQQINNTKVWTILEFLLGGWIFLTFRFQKNRYHYSLCLLELLL